MTVGMGDSPENYVMLANVLIAKGFAGNWLSDASKAGCLFLKEEHVFPKDFSNSIFREMHTLKRLLKNCAAIPKLPCL